MPDYSDIVAAAAEIGVVEAVLIFVIFVLASVLFALLRMLRNIQKDQADLNKTMVEALIRRDLGDPEQ